MDIFFCAHARVGGFSEKAYLAAAAANKQDLPALPNLEQAVADFEERFHQAGVG